MPQILFLDRVKNKMGFLGPKGHFDLFLTAGKETHCGEDSTALEGVKRRRIQGDDLLDALGPVNERSDTVCYVCGVPAMTDYFVDLAQKADGMDERNVFCEKWW